MLFPFSLMGEQLSAKDLSAEKAMNYDCFINSLLMAGAVWLLTVLSLPCASHRQATQLLSLGAE